MSNAQRVTREQMAKLYRPAPAALAAGLVDVGDALAASLADLARDPHLVGCDRVASQLSSALHAVGRLRVALAEGSS